MRTSSSTAKKLPIVIVAALIVLGGIYLSVKKSVDTDNPRVETEITTATTSPELSPTMASTSISHSIVTPTSTPKIVTVPKESSVAQVTATSSEPLSEKLSQTELEKRAKASLVNIFC